jgi:N-glycosylase/DNA lyase
MSSMEIPLDSSKPFSLDFTLCCGQAFRWDKQGDWWYGVVRDKVFKIRQIGSTLEFANASTSFVENYFGLNHDLAAIFEGIGRDEHVRQALNEFRGLRILLQDPWECLISYICATYKNIPAIKQMLTKLSKRFGEKTSFEKNVLYTFPTPKTLAKATNAELARCGLGYRVKYVAETAKMVHEGDFDFEDLKKMPYEEAREALLVFPGVGLKVADCVLLFSLSRLEAFPVDVWVKRIILKHYANQFPMEFVRKISERKSVSSAEYEKLNLFGRRYFGKYAGYAQEYLYHYERSR